MWRAIQGLDALRGRRAGLHNLPVETGILITPAVMTAARKAPRTGAIRLVRDDLGPKVAAILNERLAAYLPTEAVWDTRLSQVTLEHRPTTLLGTLWLQFLWAVTRVSEAVPCQQCGRIMELSTERRGARVHRRDARFCDDLCRASFHQNRKLAARALAREGLSVHDIAHQMNEPITRVRGWLRKRKAR